MAYRIVSCGIVTARPQVQIVICDVIIRKRHEIRPAIEGSEIRLSLDEYAAWEVVPTSLLNSDTY